MKVSSIFLLVLLAGTIISGIPVKSYADPQLDTLLNIATQARNSLGITISQINNMPAQINQLYKQGSDETDELAQAVTQQDVDSAKQHFLAAMKYFKETNDQINSLNATAPNDQQKTEMIQLRSEIIRLENMGKLLKTIALHNDVDINFTSFDGMLQNATQDLSSGNLDDASTQIQNANDFVVTTHNSLTKVAQERITEKEKEFTEKQIAQLNIAQANTTVNTTSQSNAGFNATRQSNAIQTTLPVNSSYVAPVANNSKIAIEHNPKDMVAELKRLVAEGKVDQAINLIKIIQAYQKLQSIEKATAISSTTNTTSTPPVNNTVPTPPSPPPAPPVNNTVPTPPSPPPAPPVNNTVPTPPSPPPAPPVNNTVPTPPSPPPAPPVNNTVPTPPSPPENTTMSTSQFTTQENHTISDQSMGHNEHLKKHDENTKPEKRHHHQN
ncbi:MAG: hypothetical protein KGI27_07440 [Thaumarchaeota archaeon]|nr:hypothetical protein [Nitrososphaerota archaeon]